MEKGSKVKASNEMEGSKKRFEVEGFQVNDFKYVEIQVKLLS